MTERITHGDGTTPDMEAVLAQIDTRAVILERYGPDIVKANAYATHRSLVHGIIAASAARTDQSLSFANTFPLDGGHYRGIRLATLRRFGFDTPLAWGCLVEQEGHALQVHGVVPDEAARNFIAHITAMGGDETDRQAMMDILATGIVEEIGNVFAIVQGNQQFVENRANKLAAMRENFSDTTIFEANETVQKRLREQEEKNWFIIEERLLLADMHHTAKRLFASDERGDPWKIAHDGTRARWEKLEEQLNEPHMQIAEIVRFESPGVDETLF